ncbi:hypothetical protein LOAG_01241 [Loa loa]|uniref:Uncharacterized protein n=1 Tax=Loa loa TaxID=7209 RepID=A0A1S0U9E8_LOALO|nr:hypothetical protein LOAG_01241 [Loa loa]EFO27238.1 hypothetical protein LOAG_01241 [Loa loa]
MEKLFNQEKKKGKGEKKRSRGMLHQTYCGSRYGTAAELQFRKDVAVLHQPLQISGTIKKLDFFTINRDMILLNQTEIEIETISIMERWLLISLSISILLKVIAAYTQSSGNTLMRATRKVIQIM